MPETDNCPSWITGRETMIIKNISGSISMRECHFIWDSSPCPPQSVTAGWDQTLQNQWKGMTRKFFMISFHERMLPYLPGIQALTSWSPVECASDWAIEAGYHVLSLILLISQCYAVWMRKGTQYSPIECCYHWNIRPYKHDIPVSQRAASTIFKIFDTT